MELIMTGLNDIACEACNAQAETVTDTEQQELLEQIPGWRIEKRNGTSQLEASFRFDNFAQALDFTNQVGAAAEQEQHHPAIITEWGKATITWWTHKIRGLHKNDFIMAARTSQIYDNYRSAL